VLGINAKLHRRDAEFAESAKDNKLTISVFEEWFLCVLRGSAVNSLNFSHDRGVRRG
jgi:hypothetical protein